MHTSVRRAVLASVALLLLVPFTLDSAPAQSNVDRAKVTGAPTKKVHRVVIQVSQNDPALMAMALNNAENLAKHYREKNEAVEIEFVAYGPGLHMLRSDTSPVKLRLKEISEKSKQITFSGCGNTMNAQSKQESKEVSLVPEARIVQTGIARIAELQEKGWVYVRP
jgi:uncharacterized protein